MANTFRKLPGRRVTLPPMDFGQIQYYCMFLCHARSGHSLFGSLLDAHPDMVIAHEFHALRFLQRGGNRDELFRGLVRRSRKFSRAGRKWNGYDYRVPNQWQGRHRKLAIIGDKMGGNSTHLLRKQPNALQQLSDTVGLPVKIFRMIRNPFDNITTISRYYHHNKLTPAIQSYFLSCSTIEKIKCEVQPNNWMDLYHEDVIADPAHALECACQFLGVATTPDYIKDCTGIVFKSARKRRYGINWTPEQRQQVEKGIMSRGYLSRYTFES